MIKFNPINDRIVDEVLKKHEINYDKKICRDDENLKGSFNKVIGNLTSMTLRKYITNIILRIKLQSIRYKFFYKRMPN